MITKRSDPIRVGAYTCERRLLPCLDRRQQRNYIIDLAYRHPKGKCTIPHVRWTTHLTCKSRRSRREYKKSWWTSSEMCEAFFWIETPLVPLKRFVLNFSWVSFFLSFWSGGRNEKCQVDAWRPKSLIPSSQPYVYTAVRLSVCSVLEGGRKKVAAVKSFLMGFFAFLPIECVGSSFGISFFFFF